MISVTHILDHYVKCIATGSKQLEKFSLTKCCGSEITLLYSQCGGKKGRKHCRVFINNFANIYRNHILSLTMFFHWWFKVGTKLPLHHLPFHFSLFSNWRRQNNTVIIDVPPLVPKTLKVLDKHLIHFWKMIFSQNYCIYIMINNMNKVFKHCIYAFWYSNTMITGIPQRKCFNINFFQKVHIFKGDIATLFLLYFPCVPDNCCKNLFL